MKKAPTIMTVSGTYFDFVNPEKSVFTIQDIAHSLAHICRFTGHCKELYSVAQHSVMVSLIVPPEMAMAGLLHDASEAFIGDVSSPLKQLLPDYKTLEKRVEKVVLNQFGINEVLPPEIKRADMILLATERRDLMPPHPDAWEWTAGVEPLDEIIRPWSPAEAREIFLDRFYKLQRGEVMPARGFNMGDMLGSPKPNPAFNDAMQASVDEEAFKKSLENLSGADLVRALRNHDDRPMKEAVTMARAIENERNAPQRISEYEERIETVWTAQNVEDLKPVLVEIIEKLWSK